MRLKGTSKKDLQKIIIENKATNLDYMIRHPQLLEQYKQSLSEKNYDEDMLKLLDPMEQDNEKKIVSRLIEKLKSLEPGVDNHQYHNLIIGCLLYIFYPELEEPKKEFVLNDGRKKIDISMINNSGKGFFSSLSRRGIPCHRIYFECKNYSQDINNPEYDQLLGRFQRYTTSVGFIVCRSLEDELRMKENVKAAANKQDKFMWVLTDKEIIDFMNRKLERNIYKIDNYLDGVFTFLIEK